MSLRIPNRFNRDGFRLVWGGAFIIRKGLLEERCTHAWDDRIRWTCFWIFFLIFISNYQSLNTLYLHWFFYLCFRNNYIRIASFSNREKTKSQKRVTYKRRNPKLPTIPNQNHKNIIESQNINSVLLGPHDFPISPEILNSVFFYFCRHKQLLKTNLQNPRKLVQIPHSELLLLNILIPFNLVNYVLCSPQLLFLLMHWPFTHVLWNLVLCHRA